MREKVFQFISHTSKWKTAYIFNHGTWWVVSFTLCTAARESIPLLYMDRRLDEPRSHFGCGDEERNSKHHEPCSWKGAINDNCIGEQECFTNNKYNPKEGIINAPHTLYLYTIIHIMAKYLKYFLSQIRVYFMCWYKANHEGTDKLK